MSTKKADSKHTTSNKTVSRSFRWARSLLAFIAAVVLCTGCVTNGRRVMLKEYGPSVPVLTNASLKGATVYIKGFTCAPDLIGLELKTKPEEPTPFKYTSLPVIRTSFGIKK